MQLYLVTVTVDIGEAIEETKVCVVANNADNAGHAACIHCQIAPSLAQVEVKRIKGNCYGFSQETRRKPKLLEITPCDKENDGRKLPFSNSPTVREAEIIQAAPAHRPALIKRTLELRASLYSRTDGAAWVGLGKAVEQFGRTGRWESPYCSLEQMDCKEGEERRPANTRIEEQANYSVTRVYRN